MPHEGILFVLVGPSGAGKNTLMKRVQQCFPDLRQLATVTTRNPRDGEQQGREHWFVTANEFQHLIETDALVEWQRVHLDDLYGTPRKTIDEAIEASHDLIADIEFLGASQLRKQYPAHTVLIFVTPARLEILAERILKRGYIEQAALIDRLERAKFEMTFAPQCDYVVLNDQRARAAEQLRRIIASERHRRRGEPVDPALLVPRHSIHTTVTAVIQHEDKLLVRAGVPGPVLPAFTMENSTDRPHEMLKRKIRETLNCEITIGTISDRRFDFLAPNHVTIAANPPDIQLNFYYKCALQPSHPAQIPGWEWQPLAVLDLPETLHELVAS